MKRKTVYQETYRKGTLARGCEVKLSGFDVIETQVNRAGRFDDGTEFLDVRVIVKEKA